MTDQCCDSGYGTHLRGQVVRDIASNDLVTDLGVVFVVDQGSRASPLTPLPFSPTSCVRGITGSSSVSKQTTHVSAT